MSAQHPRKRRRKRKCACCRELYLPDPRHLHDQKYCSKPACRRASKQASQRRWYYSEKGTEYRDPEFNKQRMGEWRANHPGYSKRRGTRAGCALQDMKVSEVADAQEVAPSLNDLALQDLMSAQPALVVGLVAHLTGSALQETIAETSRRFVLLGRDILGAGPGSNPKAEGADETAKAHSMPGAFAPGTGQLQLD